MAEGNLLRYRPRPFGQLPWAYLLPGHLKPNVGVVNSDLCPGRSPARHLVVRPVALQLAARPVPQCDGAGPAAEEEALPQSGRQRGAVIAGTPFNVIE